MLASMKLLGGLEPCPPGNFWKISQASEMQFLVSFSTAWHQLQPIARWRAKLFTNVAHRLLLFVGASGLLVCWTNSFKGTCALVIVNKSSSESFNSEHPYFILVLLMKTPSLLHHLKLAEKTKTQPGALNHSDATIAQKRQQQAAQFPIVDKEIY